MREALQIAGEVNGWVVRQVNFIMGTRLIEVSSWDKSMQELGVSKDITDRLRSKLMRRLLEEHEAMCYTVTGRRGSGKDREVSARARKQRSQKEGLGEKW